MGIWDCAIAAKDAGWTGIELVRAVAIAGAEGGWRKNAHTFGNPAYCHSHSDCGKTYSCMFGTCSCEDSCGPWQINTCNGGDCGSLQDYATNAATAYAMYQARGWTPWTTYTSRAYLAFVVPAAVAVGFNPKRAQQMLGAGNVQQHSFKTGSNAPSTPSNADKPCSARCRVLSLGNCKTINDGGHKCCSCPDKWTGKGIVSAFTLTTTTCSSCGGLAGDVAAGLHFFEGLFQPHNWVRLAEVLAAAILFIIAVVATAAVFGRNYTLPGVAGKVVGGLGRTSAPAQEGAA